jgi:adenylate kinase
LIILFFGPPGCGKGTQSRMILDWLPHRVPSLSTGEMLRAEVSRGTLAGQRARAAIASGGLVGDEAINTMLAERIGQPDCRHGFLLDGYPRTPCQARFLDGLLQKRGLPAPLVIHLDVPAEALVGRMISRRQCSGCGLMFNILSRRPRTPGRCDACGALLTVRKDDREEVIRERLRVYEAQTQPVLTHYRNGNYVRIPGEGSPAYIFETITQALEPVVHQFT